MLNNHINYCNIENYDYLCTNIKTNKMEHIEIEILDGVISTKKANEIANKRFNDFLIKSNKKDAFVCVKLIGKNWKGEKTNIDYYFKKIKSIDEIYIEKINKSIGFSFKEMLIPITLMMLLITTLVIINVI